MSRKGQKSGKKKKNWIQKAIKHPGALHKHLGIPMNKKIPKTLLVEIKEAEVGQIIKNPTKTGKRRIKVTETLKKEATLALTLRRFHRKSKKKVK